MFYIQDVQKNLHVTDLQISHTLSFKGLISVTSAWTTFLQSEFKNPTNHTTVPSPHKETCTLICKEIPESTAHTYSKSRYSINT
jgi:hypothetical protein